MKKEEWLRLETALKSIIAEYNRMNHLMSLGNDINIRRAAIKHIRHNATILDAGCGMGIMTEIAMAEINPKKIVMMDPNKALLAKVKNDGTKVTKVVGVFENIPFRAESFDAVMCGFSFRDALNYDRAAAELSRVLKRGGLLVIVDLGKPDGLLRYLFYAYIAIIPSMMMLFINKKKLKHYFTLFMTFKNYLTYSSMIELFSKHRLKLVKFKKMLMGGLLYQIWEKQ